MHYPHISIIGAGNMGSSLIGGLINSGFPADNIIASDPNSDQLRQLQEKFHIQTSSDNVQALQTANVLILAVKPQMIPKIAAQIAPIIHSRKILVISIAAGVRLSILERDLGDKTAIVRTMPNTPALVGSGASALYANAQVSAEQREIAESILRSVGIIVWLEQEAQMDIVTGLSGSGPAYFFLVMEALQEAAEQMGLNAEIARLLTLQTALGAAHMAIETDQALSELRHSVTSPGGTTEQAIAVLEQNKLRLLFKKALQAAALRSEELAQLLEKNENASTKHSS